jgi:hypothetical protein
MGYTLVSVGHHVFRPNEIDQVHRASRHPSLNNLAAAAMQGAGLCQKPKYILLFG